MQNKPVFILLAGGKSERMGVEKGLLKFKQTYWILEQIRRISKTSIKKVYIGLGYNYQQYFDAIDWFEKASKTPVSFMGIAVSICINKTPEHGSFSTLQTVIKSIPTNSEVLINPIDTPILNAVELESIIETKNDVVIPNYHTKNGHPIKLTAFLWKDFINIPLENKNARLDYQIKKIASSKVSHISVLDNAILLNLNTPKDWESYCSLYN